MTKPADATETLQHTAATALHRGPRGPGGAPALIRSLHADGPRIADIARLKHEYAVLRELDAPGLLAVLAVEEHDQRVDIVLADFAGDDLAELLRTQGPLAAEVVLPIAIDLARALADLHRAGLLHGDLRPRNILARPRPGAAPELRLIGLAVEAALTREHDAIYSPAVLAEVLPYWSPERTGRMNRSVDAGADLYSLGVVLYELLAGRPPFVAGDPIELFHAHIALLPPPLQQLAPRTPPAIAAIVHRLLGKNAEDRYHGAAGLLAALLECQRLAAAGHDLTELGPDQLEAGEHLRLPQRLYGRDDDINRLIAGFDRAVAGRREVVLVSGYSGIGKSSLVREVLKPLARTRGYYISGKFDQYDRDIPYSALLQACEGLLRQLLSESEPRLRRWRAALLAALGADAQVLCELLPGLTRVLGEQPPVPALGPIEAQLRVTRQFERFLGVFARPEHPLVLFLDDLQWIDAATLALLLRVLLADASASLLFCGAYRDNEVGPAHPLMTARAELTARSIEIRDIVLAPLDLPQVDALIRDTLARPDCRPLAERVLRKTGGNPFFVRQFLRSLHEQGALHHAPGRGWQWELGPIDALESTANVVELMAAAIRRLPPATQDALRLAALVGGRFDLALLATVSGCSVDEAYARIDPALRDGLLLARDERLHFVHDKVQEAAYSLLPAAERPAAHLRIGRLLRARLDPAERHALFDCVNHFNAAIELLTDPDERQDVARLDLLAAERAEETAAFAGALRYLNLGGALLPADIWDRDYPLALAYATRTGLMQSLCEQLEAALATLTDAAARARGRLDQTRVLRLVMDVQVLRNDLLAALDQGRAALRLFGLDVPAFPDDAALLAELAATTAQIEAHLAARLGPAPHTDEQVLTALTDLPTLADPELIVLQDLLQATFAPCAFLGSNALPLLVMKVLQHSLRHGASRNTSYAYVNFGVFLCASGDKQRGYLFGRAAVQINRVHRDRKSESMLANMFGAFVQHWCEPHARCREILVRGMHAGLETGEYIWAFYGGVNAVTNSLLRGASLPELLAEARSYEPLCRLDRFNAITWMIRAVGQLAHNLSEPTPEPQRLHGEWIDLAPVIAESERIHNHASLFFTAFYRVLNGVFHGAYADTARLCEATDSNTVSIAAWHGNPAYRCYGGLAYALAHDEVDPDLRPRYRAQALAFAAQLDAWAPLAPANLRHRALLLRAELRRLDADTAAAADLYDAAIAAAADAGCVHDEALANELCGRFHAGLGRHTIARAYLGEAQRRYARWGAGQAVLRLERTWPLLLPRDPGRRGPRDPVNDGLDVRSVLKASQALSGEIVLPRLLARLLDIILESAGARRGVLLLRDDDRLRVEVGRDLGEARDPVQTGVYLEDSPDVPISVVQYAARSEEDLVLSDAPADGPFADDPYIARHAPRSLLAAPIRHQGRPAGVIYLENDLAAGAFTPERLEMLRLLSVQAAISIENALLYAHLEDKVAQRTGELRAAHEKIVALGREQQRRQAEDLRQQQALIVRQQQTIRALGTPIIEVWDGVLTAPIVGVLDDARALELTESLLQRISRSRSRHAIIDLTGLEELDSSTAMHLVRIVRSLQLLGATGTITGLSPAVAEALVSLGVDLRGLPTRQHLRDALRDCIAASARPNRA